MQFHYNGFTQLDEIREFIFHGACLGQERKIILVTADLSIFRKYNVGLQEGPLLCLRKLSLESATLVSNSQSLLQRKLCEDDICAFAAEREHQRTKKSTHRRSRASGSEMRLQ
jgi:hypothetical protein